MGHVPLVALGDRGHDVGGSVVRGYSRIAVANVLFAARIAGFGVVGVADVVVAVLAVRGDLSVAAGGKEVGLDTVMKGEMDGCGECG